MEEAERRPDQEASAEEQEDGWDAKPGGKNLRGDTADHDAQDRRRHTVLHTQRSLKRAGRGWLGGSQRDALRVAYFALMA
ncbi:hypothetical protein [Methylobacterium tardum]|uniref:Uncharacterized protein n=1 Tax=Methylobacterium tardum TaxID=374432 RepID=A0AA37TJ97_9HYPH|nr:hypothetical protein [Methylobacterium tardum]URD36041.1 hypothetical protein M6G65_27020 [Methylobacterium tardum]GLS69018.1 hypothetical protein GCM10007890_10300 [Methylobacterium tardum]